MSTHIFHNPRCSKSRQTLSLLQEHGHEPEIVLYLDTPLTIIVVERLRDQLGLSTVRDMMRKGESAYKEQTLREETSEAALIEAIIANPKLLERPIVVRNGQAKIGRPPENVLSLWV